MKWYRCLIRGENFPGALIGRDQPVGFYTTQFAQGTSPEDAELKALTLLKTHTSLQLPDGVDKPKSARVFFEEIVEVDGEDVADQQQGLSFYPMDE